MSNTEAMLRKISLGRILGGFWLVLALAIIASLLGHRPPQTLGIIMVIASMVAGIVTFGWLVVEGDDE